jgi:branched-chain amino acid transport system ATP-binding protein
VSRLQLRFDPTSHADAVGDGASGSDGGYAVELAPGEAALLPDRDDLIRWLAGDPAARGEGELHVDGRRLTARSAAARVRAGLVVLGDPPVAPSVTLLDHLAAVTSRRAARDLLEATPRLAGRADDPAGVLSGGERRLLGWARTVLLLPTVVVLDRSGTGLDTDAVRWAGTQVDRWRAAGTAVLVRVGRTEEVAWARGS